MELQFYRYSPSRSWEGEFKRSYWIVMPPTFAWSAEAVNARTYWPLAFAVAVKLFWTALKSAPAVAKTSRLVISAVPFDVTLKTRLPAAFQYCSTKYMVIVCELFAVKPPI